ncbi:MAG: hypothetical protein ACLVBP_15760 [Ruminococcus sp.]
MLDDKTVTEHNIEDKSVQEVTAEATKVCCQCGERITFTADSVWRSETKSVQKAYRIKV